METARRNLVFSAVFLVLIGVAVWLYSWPRKADAPAFLESALLKRLPETTIGFGVVSLKAEGYRRYSNSPFAKAHLNVTEQLKNLAATAELQDLNTLAEALEKSGLVRTSPAQNEALDEIAAYAAIDPERKRLDLALCLGAAPGIDLTDKLSTMRSVLKARGVDLREENFGKAAGFSWASGLQLPFEARIGLTGAAPAVYAAADREHLIVASSSRAVNAFLGGQSKNGLQNLRSSAAFNKIAAFWSGQSAQFAAGFLDAARLIESAADMLSGPQQEATRNLPLSALYFSYAMQESLQGRLALALAPKNQDQERWLSALKGPAGNNAWRYLPADTVLALSLEGSLLAQLKDRALLEVPAAELAQLKESLAVLDSLRSLSLGLRPGSGASPFPELLVVASSPAAQEVIAGLKNQLQGALGDSGLLASAWQQKEVAGIQTQFILSPFGVGAYLAAHEDKAILASSEKALSDLLEILRKKGKALGADLAPTMRQILQGTESHLVFYGNFESLANSLNALQGSLSMFTGGQPLLDAQKIQSIKDIGILLVSAKYDSQVLDIQSASSVPSQK